MAIETGTWLREAFGFAGPAIGIIDRGEDGELILPSTDGDCTITPSEETFEVTFDETGPTPRQVYSLGERVEIRYPMKKANLEAFAFAFSSNNYTLTDTEDPDGSAALTARKTAQQTSNTIHQKTEMTLDIFPFMDQVFDEAAAAVARTADKDVNSFYFPQVVAAQTGDAQMTFRNGESVYTLMFIGVLPATTDTYYRLFNTDLALPA